MSGISGAERNIRDAMKKSAACWLIMGMGLFITAGCASTYQQDCNLLLDSEPSGAEIWKEGFFIGFTPYVLRYTTTWEDKEKGYLRLPPLLIKKEGFEPRHLNVEINLNDGYYWEGVARLTPQSVENEN